MTLTEARKILEQHLAWCRSCVDDPEPPKPDSNDLYKAIEVAISALPKDSALPTVSARPTAEERFRQVRSRLMARGCDPFGSRRRDIPTVALRQCVFLMLRREGYTYHAIARAALYDHSTVVWGRNKALDLINLCDPLYQRTWNDLNWIDLGLL